MEDEREYRLGLKQDSVAACRTAEKQRKKEDKEYEKMIVGYRGGDNEKNISWNRRRNYVVSKNPAEIPRWKTSGGNGGGTGGGETGGGFNYPAAS
ncbi:hypothetical protein V1478_015987 [Vespula squamosa]|uniref:Uncharacterized protein n=1 Tax=Vespula squamosa TaxID=30214 RepID=A0ABD2A343_VESSQ